MAKRARGRFSNDFAKPDTVRRSSRGMHMLFKRMLVPTIIVAAVTALSAGAQTSRQEVEAKVNALTPQETREVLLKAQAGDANAQYLLGRAHQLGRSVARSDAEAAKWIRKAADQGHVLAEMSLANMYFQGEGVPRDDNEGMRWMRKAADHRDAMAQFMLGYLLEQRGKASEAASWYRKAAEQGLAMAETALGFVYEHGKGVPQDDKQAVDWYRKAADQSEANAQSNLGSMYYLGKGVKKDLAEAARWYQKSAEGGWFVGQQNLANMYVSGEGVPRDYVSAYMWYTLAASAGDETSRSMMGTVAGKMKSEEIAEAKRRADQWSKTHDASRDAGGGVFITEKKASQEDWDALRKLKGDAERGDPAAQSVLGEAYYRSQDYQNASVWFRKSAEQGYAPGQYNLGVMYLEGSGTAKDAAEALKWFLKAAEQRHLGAMNNLAALYFYGTGVPKDLLQTYMWIRIAAQFGDENSTKNLAGLKEQLTGAQVAEGERRASQWLAEHPKR